jgi:hypothetical protein
MKYALIAVLLTVSGCGLFGGYGYSQPGYIPPSAYGPQMGAMGYGGGYFVPPPPPEDRAFVNGHGYPGAWRGSNRVRLANGTDWYVHVKMDGVEISVVDQYVGLPPMIPPRQDAFFYVAFGDTDPRTGCEEHHFEFDAYEEGAVLYPDPTRPLRPVVQSGRYVTFCAGSEEQLVQIGHY